MNYIAEDSFMIRTPMFSQDFYRKLFSDTDNFTKNIAELTGNMVLMEGIAIASPDLYYQIKKIKEDNSDIVNHKKVINSLLKYAVRASTRTTPFGLFSGFDICCFADQSSLHLESRNKYQKRARADMEWVNGIVKLLENDPEVIQKVKVYTNSILYKKGTRLINPYLCSENVSFGKELNITASIRLTNQVKYILTACQDGIGYGSLKDKLISQNPQVESSKIDHFLSNLFKNDYIISELRMPKSNINSIDYLLEILEQNKIETPLYGVLNEIQDLIVQYNQSLPGEGLEIFDTLQVLMKKVFECRSYLQVDLKINTENSGMSHKVKQKCEKVATKLINLSRCIDEYPSIREYKKLFFEKYGPYLEVPILELLDAEMGLGSPAGYTLPMSDRFLDSKKNDENNFGAKDIKLFLLSKITFAHYSGLTEITLTDEDIVFMDSLLSKYNNNNNTPASLDMNFFVFAKNKEEIDAGNYTLAIGPNVGADRAGRTLGRFADMLDNEEQSIYNSLYYKSKDLLREDHILAEIIEEPLSSRVGNVVLNQNKAEYQTTIGSIGSKNLKEIKLNDIVIGIDPVTNYFYAKSRSYDKRVKYTVFNMLNPVGASNSYRFLREISSSGDYNFIQAIHGMLFDELIYIPRIVYDNCILSPKSWKLHFSLLGRPQRYEEFVVKFNKWRREWNLPRFIYHKDLDNIMLFDLDNELQLEELYRLVKKEEILILIDYEIEEEAWVRDNNNEQYYSEYVLSFFKAEKQASSSSPNKEKSNKLNTKSNISGNKSPVTLQDNNRTLLPGDMGWWFLKLYCSNKNINSIIFDDIMPFCQTHVDKGIFNKFYFIRYADPGVHIRLRIQLSNPGANFSEIVYPWLKNLQLNVKLNDFSIHTYERELERYGGAEVFELAEDYFYFDSLYVANLLQKKNDTTRDEILAITSNLNILKEFGLGTEDQISYFENNFKGLNLFKKEFKASTRDYINLIQEADHLPELRRLDLENTADSVSLSDLFIQRSEKLRNYVKALQKQDNAGLLTNSKNDILSSIMHMHANRFRGDTVWEQKTLELTYRTVYAYKNYKKHLSLVLE